MSNNPIILIVDDDPTNIMVLGKVLRNNEFHIEAATSGPQALSILNEVKPDLILLDVMMPDMDGFETCRLIKANKQTTHIPVIFVSALSEVTKMVEGINCGAIDFILKPFNVSLLLSKVNVHVDLKRKTEEVAELNRTLEQKVAERTQELEKANDELRKLDEVKSEFLRIISHEVRTPLNGIAGFAMLIKRECKSDRIEHIMNLLEKSISRLERFALNALLYIELKSGKYQVAIRPFKITEIIEAVIERLAPEFQEKKLELAIEIDTAIKIKVDQDLAINCLLSVMNNAVRFSDSNTKITLAANETDQGVLIRVIDQGKGFSEKAIAQLFKPFSPGEDFVNENEGLELAICKLIIDMHQGHISVLNLDKGASVNLFFKS